MNNIDRTAVLKEALNTLTTLKNRTQIDQWPDCIWDMCETTITLLERAIEPTISNFERPNLPNPNYVDIV